MQTGYRRLLTLQICAKIEGNGRDVGSFRCMGPQSAGVTDSIRSKIVPLDTTSSFEQGSSRKAHIRRPMSAKCVPKPAPHFDPINRHDADRPTDPGAAVLQTDAKNFHEVDGIPQKETLAPGHDVEPLDPAGSTDMSIVRMVTLTIAMLLTFFLATVAVAAVTLLIPSMVRDLGGTQLQMQWVSSDHTELWRRILASCCTTCDRA